MGHAKTSKECPLRYIELRALQTTTTEGSSASVQETSISGQPHSPPATTSQHAEQGLSELSDRAPCESVSEFQHPTMQPATRLELILLAQNSHGLPPNQLSAKIVQEPPTLSVDKVSPPPNPTSARSLRYDDPRAIYERYVKDRESWYKAQRPGTYVNNRMYRQARGLPLGFKKESYEWCLDYKRMGKHCTASTGQRDWTKEEMMAYLDWDNKENERIEAEIAQELQDGRFEVGRRGADEVWRRAEEDSAGQQILYEAQQDKSCIIVQP